jgi:sulfite exporter TauE/SafE
MKAADRLVAVLILLLGAVHAAVGPVLRGRPDIAGMWFLSGGLMMIFLGLLNLVRSGSPTAAARWAALGANLLTLAFVVELARLASLRQNPQVTVIILLIAAATVFSLVPSRTRSAR